MEKDVHRIAAKCPLFDSVRSSRGIEGGSFQTRDVAPRCDHCAYWMGGSCDLFLSKGI